MQILVQEMFIPEYPNLGGEHAWVDIVFSSGRTITVRVDEYTSNEDHQSRVYIRRNDEIGTEVNI